MPFSTAQKYQSLLNTIRRLVAVLAGVSVCALTWAQDARTDSAEQLFAQYLALEQAYDPGIAALYADEASIKSRRTYPMGEPRDTIIAGADYKRLLRQLMPVAKARGDRNTYSKVDYTPEGERVRINASRFSELQQRTSPFSLLVGRSRSGNWLIYEEFSEAQQ
jgi:hypothetical protein